jgi:hypothetical protein
VVARDCGAAATQTRIRGYGWRHFRGQPFQTASLVSGCAFDRIQQHQINRIRKLTYKTAWFMCHRHREPMRDGHITVQLGGEGKMVKIDETAARFALTLSRPPLAHVL